MARRIDLPGSPPPVNDGERRVVKALVERLPDDYVVWPAVQVVQRHQVDDLDILVRTPDCLVAIEVKDLAGDVFISDQEFVVDGESRSHSYLSVAQKAKRLKSRLVDRDPAMRSVWVAGLAVLARKPSHLDRSPSLADRVVDIDRAIELLQDTSRLGSRGQALGDLADRVDAQISSERPRRRRPVFGSYRVTEVLVEDDHETRARGEHILTGREVRLRVVKLSEWSNPAENQLRRTQALREVEALQRLGDDPAIVGEREAFQVDDGSLVLVADPPRGPSLTEAADAGLLDDETRWRVLSSVVLAVQHAHRAEIVHRRISPSQIEIPASGALPRLGGFGFAKLRSSMAGSSPTITPHEWSGVIEAGFVAPELEEGADHDAGVATDYWSLGTLARFLWPDRLPNVLQEAVPKLLAADAPTRAAGYEELRGAIRSRLAPSAPPSPKFVPQKGAHLGEYVLEAPLGDGSSSSVWRAYDELGGEVCAIKILSTGDAKEHLRHEYRALRRIHHPNVVEVRMAGTDPVNYLVTELLEGQTLAEVLDAAEAGRLALDDGILIARDLLEALSTIHPDVAAITALTDAESLDDAKRDALERLRMQGVVHRDVKPENVMITEHGAVLFDFGLAASGTSASPGGTAHYRPADASADSMDPDVDLFAIGVILYETLTGRHPYPDRRPTLEPPADPRELADGIPDAISEVMLKTCAPTRSERYESAAELLEDIDDALWASGAEDDEPPSAEPPAAELPVPPRPVEQIEAFAREGTLDSVLGADTPAGADTSGAFKIGPLTVAPVGRIEQLAMTSPSGERFDGAAVERWVVELADGGALELRYVTEGGSGSGESWVECADSRDVPARLERLRHGMQIRVRREGDRAWCELRIARVTQGDWSNEVKARLSEIDGVSGCDAKRVLCDLGADAVGTRAEVLDHDGPRADYVAVTFPTDATKVAVAAYVLTRVLPLARAGS